MKLFVKEVWSCLDIRLFLDVERLQVSADCNFFHAAEVGRLDNPDSEHTTRRRKVGLSFLRTLQKLLASLITASEEFCLQEIALGCRAELLCPALCGRYRKARRSSYQRGETPFLMMQQYAFYVIQSIIGSAPASE